MKRLSLMLVVALVLSGCKYCLAPLAIFIGPEQEPTVVTASDAGYQNENWWPDSGSSTVEDITDADGGAP